MSTSSERQIVGAVLAWPEQSGAFITVGEEGFTAPALRRMWKAIRQISDEGGRPGLVEVTQRLAREGIHDAVFLTQLAGEAQDCSGGPTMVELFDLPQLKDRAARAALTDLARAVAHPVGPVEPLAQLCVRVGQDILDSRPERALRAERIFTRSTRRGPQKVQR